MTKVLATGVFNIIHPGHIFFLEEAKKLGDELVVIVSSDALAKKISKKKVLPQEHRVAVVSALKPVDKAFIGDSEDTMKLLPVIRPDVIALGHDQKVDEDWLQDELNILKVKARVIRLKKKWEGKFDSTSAILKELGK